MYANFYRNVFKHVFTRTSVFIKFGKYVFIKYAVFHKYKYVFVKKVCPKGKYAHAWFLDAQLTAKNIKIVKNITHSMTK